MFIATYKDAYGVKTSNLYTSWSQYFSDTFSPCCEELELIDFTVKGKTYQERKASAQQIGIDFSYTIADDLSYMEYAMIGYKLETIAKQYGLVKEFKENGLI